MGKPIKSFFKSFKHAFHGILWSLKGRNFKVQLVIAIFVLITGIYFSLSWLEWLVIILAIFAVLVGEMFNTAIEEVCNIVKDIPGVHATATKEARDIAAGGVLIISIGAIAIGTLVFLPKIINLFS